MEQDDNSDLLSRGPCFPAQVLARSPRSFGWFLTMLVLACWSAQGVGAVDPDAYAQKIKDNAVGGTVLDKVIGNVSARL